MERRWAKLDFYLVASISLATAVLRLWRLGEPSQQVFDENFYAKDGCHYATTLLPECGLRGIFEVHPPMGKWPIALGIKLFGFNAFGSRIFSAFAGTALVVVTYLIARRILNSTLGATVAASFVALDLLLFVHSRLAMLDIFLALFIMTGFLFVTWDVSKTREAPAGTSARWRFLAGFFFGSALATKWIGALALLAGALLVVAAEVRARREAGATRPLRATVGISGGTLVLCFVIVPLVIYLGSYVGRVQGTLVGWPWQEGTWVRAFWDQQVLMWDYFQTPRTPNIFQSSSLTWLSALWPFPYHFETEGTRYGGVMAAGSPLMWWPAVGAVLYGSVRWARTRSSSIEAAIPMAGLVATYGGWLLPALIGYQHFYLYYLVPAIPFLGLLVASAIMTFGRKALRVGISIALIASWVAFLGFMYPLLAAVRIDAASWASRARFYRICPVPEHSIERFALPRHMNEACRVGGLPFLRVGE